MTKVRAFYRQGKGFVETPTQVIELTMIVNKPDIPEFVELVRLASEQGVFEHDPSETPTLTSVHPMTP